MKILYRNFSPELVFHERKGVSMAPEITIVDSLPEHVGALKSNLRREDANEILRFGVSIQHALWRGYRGSIYRKTAFIDGIPAAMWGVCGALLGGKGQVWLMTTPDVYKVSPLKFARIYQEETRKMLRLFPLLENYALAEYDAAIRLLDICGFSMGEPEPMGINRALHRKFWIERK